MKRSQNYYENLLYPLQDKVLQILTNESDFYLTGGTALSRAYFDHRYSDDLDFFLNHSPEFKKQVERCLSCLEVNFPQQIEYSLSYDAFYRIFVNNAEVSLKVEFINDVLFRYGQPQPTAIFNKTDIVRNILSNKITALSRNAAKDIADIIEIAKNYSFNWQDIINDAKQKDTWVDEADVLIALKQFPIEALQEVKWKKEFDVAPYKMALERVVEDIFKGQNNRLHV